jgi:prevent-host-death family protein
MVMKGIKTAELKAHLSQYLHRVRRGEEIVVLDRSTPVARIVPYRAAEPLRLPARPPIAGARPVGARRFPPLDAHTQAVAALLADRRSR